MRIRFATLVASAMALSACGGGSGSSPPSTGGPTPSPSPSPSPSPTPSPTPVSYTPIVQLQGSQSFESSCGVLNLTSDPAAEGVFPFADPDGVAFSYVTNDLFDPDQDNWEITGDTLDLTFTPDNLRPSQNQNVLLYTVQVVSGFIQLFAFVTPEIGGVSAEYVRSGVLSIERFDNQVKDYRCVLGVPLDSSDALPTSAFSYANLEGSGLLYRYENDPEPVEYFLSGTAGSLDVDRSQGRLRLSIDVSGEFSANNQGTGNDDQFGTFNADIPFSGNARQFEGPLLDSNLMEVGEFSGVFFGPEGTELGIVFSANAQDDTNQDFSFSGSLLGRR